MQKFRVLTKFDFQTCKQEGDNEPGGGGGEASKETATYHRSLKLQPGRCQHSKMPPRVQEARRSLSESRKETAVPASNYAWRGRDPVHCFSTRSFPPPQSSKLLTLDANEELVGHVQGGQGYCWESMRGRR
jgi:hypothetical protein